VSSDALIPPMFATLVADLLVAQRLDGVHLRRFVGRIQAEEDAHDQGKKKRDADGFRRDNGRPSHHRGQQFRPSDAGGHADGSTTTTELKSAISWVILPETWLPTCTDTTGLTVPVAVTIAVMGPRSTSAVL